MNVDLKTNKYYKAKLSQQNHGKSHYKKEDHFPKKVYFKSNVFFPLSP